MILSALLAFAAAGPTLEEAQTCRAHVELFIEEVMAESGRIAGPTWFIRDWWDIQAEEAGAPDDDEAILASLRADLLKLRVDAPERFEADRKTCFDTAIEAGALP